MDFTLVLVTVLSLTLATVMTVLAWRLAREGFKIPHSAVQKGLQEVSWPGRLEAVQERLLVLLDGAHNPAAARELAEEYFDARKVLASLVERALTPAEGPRGVAGLIPPP